MRFILLVSVAYEGLSAYEFPTKERASLAYLEAVSQQGPGTVALLEVAQAVSLDNLLQSFCPYEMPSTQEGQ